MNITTTARRCTLDVEDKRFAQVRLERLARFLRAPERDRAELHLVVMAEKNRHEAEITLRVLRRELVSREGGLDPRAAIGLAADQLEQRIRKLKDRAAERRKGDRTRLAAGPPAAGGENEEWGDLLDAAEGE